MVSGGGEGLGGALRSTANLPSIGRGDIKPDQLLDLIKADQQRLESVLHAYGYYEGDASVFLNGKPLDTDAAAANQDLQAAYSRGPIDILYVPTFGRPYRIRTIQVAATINGTKQMLCGSPCPSLDHLVGKPATATNLADAETAWLSRQSEAQNALHPVVDRAISVDRRSQTVDVMLTLDTQSQVRLGSVEFAGLQRMTPQALQRYVPFRAGDLYRPALIEHLRAVLEQSSLFQAIHIEVAATPDASGFHPVLVNLMEKPQSAAQIPLMGAIGAGIFVVTALILGTSLLARASVSPFWRSLEQPLHTATVVALLLSSLIAIERFFYFANI